MAESCLLMAEVITFHGNGFKGPKPLDEQEATR
jgi:hypothetical protein